MLVIVCTAYSFLVLYHISTNANFNLGDFRFIKSGMRDYVTHWPQRFPTVMMAAFFFLLFKSKTNKTYLIPLLLVSVCLFFTFTRAIYVSIIMGFLYLVFFYLLKFKVRLKKKSMFFFAVYASLIIGLIYFLQGTVRSCYSSTFCLGRRFFVYCELFRWECYRRTIWRIR